MTPRLVTRPLRWLGLFSGLLLSSCLALHAQSYTWNTVRVGGGGAVPTVQAHPKVPNLFFITTDVGTPYRWNNTSQRWEGMFYKATVSGWDYRSAAGRIAFDPSDTTGNILYATTGAGWANDGTILKSTDRGTTWTACPIPLDVFPNKEQGAGQRIAVDPQNSNVVYVTTRSSATTTSINGTFKSTNAGASWTKINNLYGSFVQFDVSGGLVSGVTKNIFIGCTDGVYRSTDGGATFTLMAGSPVGVARADIHSNGTLYVTAGNPWAQPGPGGVFKWNGTAWSTITPATAGSYAAVAVNPQNSLEVVVSSTNFNTYVFNHYRSNNGGSSWTYMGKTADKTEVPWFDSSIGQATSGFCWDPFNATSVWFTDFFFAYQTTNVWAASNVTWKARAAGHEESVSIGTLACPPSGTNLLLSSVADIGGWDHKSLTAPPVTGMMTSFPFIYSSPANGSGNMTGVAFEETNPNFIARVGRVSWNGAGYAGYSTDGGASVYTKWTCPSGAAGGRIAVAANTETMVWVPQGGSAYRSTNRGVNWTAIPTLPSNLISGADVFSSGPRYPLAADKVNGNKFYVYTPGTMYVSTDAGATFATAGTLGISYAPNNLTVETTPGKEGDIWVGMTTGLYHSTNSGSSFPQIANVQSVELMAVGKASATNPTVPAIYVFGTVNNVANSLFRSDDNGASWTNIGVPQIGSNPISMAADRNVYGRVFFGTSGNGIMVGDIQYDVIVDNTSAGVTTMGTWTSSSFTPGYYGADYLHDGNANKGSMALRWTPTLPVAGNYTVYARWTSDANRATNVPIDVNSTSGTTTVTVNMQANGGTWVSLGTYAFNAGTGGSVRVSNTGTNGYVIADAVRFLKQ